MNFDLNKTLEQLEKVNIIIPKDESYLITTCAELYKKPLIEFEIEDLRIMIGQNIGLKYLIPIAINFLDENILAEGHFYEGDLLKSVLTSDITYWKSEISNWKKIIEIFENNTNLFNEIEFYWKINKQLFESFENFKLINK